MATHLDNGAAFFPFRLAAFMTGAPNRPKHRAEGASSLQGWLLGLDSNQQPSG